MKADGYDQHYIYSLTNLSVLFINAHNQSMLLIRSFSLTNHSFCGSWSSQRLLNRSMFEVSPAGTPCYR